MSSRITRRATAAAAALAAAERQQQEESDDCSAIKRGKRHKPATVVISDDEADEAVLRNKQVAADDDQDSNIVIDSDADAEDEAEDEPEDDQAGDDGDPADDPVQYTSARAFLDVALASSQFVGTDYDTNDGAYAKGEVLRILGDLRYVSLACSSSRWSKGFCNVVRLAHSARVVEVSRERKSVAETSSTSALRVDSTRSTTCTSSTCSDSTTTTASSKSLFSTRQRTGHSLLTSFCSGTST